MKITATALGVMLLAGCGGTSGTAAAPPSSTAPSATTVPSASPSVDLAAAYLAAVAPANRTVDVFNAKIDGLNTAAEASAAVAPVVASFSAVEQKLARLPWTGQAATDARAVIGASAALRASLQSAAEADVFSASTLRAAFNRDAAQFGAAVTVLRADLGLPPAS